jgi:hypothetical protein
MVSQASKADLMKPLSIRFRGEAGVDEGGVSREFFYLLCNAAFSLDYGMFTAIAGGKYWFNTASDISLYFSLLGTIVALAAYNSVILPIRFPLVLYKKLLNRRIGLSDLAELEGDDAVRYLESLRGLPNLGDAGITFSITIDCFGHPTDVPLKEGGEDIVVTNETVEEYIQLRTDYLLNRSVENQFNNFRKGFIKLAEGTEMLNLFREDELDILVSGTEVVDWGALKTTARYIDGYTKESNVIVWFWELFDEMAEEDKKKFLRFSTGTDRLPIEGIAQLRLTIQRTGDDSKFPVAHTCFNILGLPEYPSKEKLKAMLMLAIQECEGFGLV